MPPVPATLPATLETLATSQPAPAHAHPGLTATLRLPHAFALCQLGAESAAKAELLRRRPQDRLAFMRPGLLTWKCEPAPSAEELAAGLSRAVFLRSVGASLGLVSSVADVVQRVRGLLAAESVLSSGWGLQVFAREGRESQDPSDEALAADERRVAEVSAAIALALPELALHPGPARRAGQLILDVVLPPLPRSGGADQPDPGVSDRKAEPWLLGLHRHHLGRSPHPGGRPPLRLPLEAPSRAWLKLEEGLLWSGLPLRAGQVAVEIGAAPGGASYALLQRGLTVVGVDPGAMDPRLLALPRFTHLQTTLADLRREALPARVDWLLLDVNLAPPVALHALRRLVSTLRSTLRGALLTLKLNDWGLAEQIPRWLEQVAAMGFEDVRATQLCSNRQEICIAAQRRMR